METLSTHTVDFYPLTAIHVGSGAVLDPYEYLVQNGEVVRLNFRRLLSRLAAAQEADRYIEAINTNLAEAEAIAVRHIDDSCVIARYPAAPGFEEYWRHRLATSIETLELTLMPATMDGFYIPGSSLKGSIRTAYYAVLGQSMQYPAEWDVFGHKRYPLDSSPFKRMKIADIDVGNAVEVAAIHGMKIEDWTSGAPDVVRMLVRGNFEMMAESGMPADLFGDLSVMPRRFDASVSFMNGYPGDEVVSLQTLIAHTKAFCAAQIQYEMQRPNIGGFYQWFFDAVRPAMERPDTTLVRLGYGGGRLATSVLVYAPEVIEQELAKAKFALSRNPHPKVRKFAGQYPMGWALMRFRERGR